MIHHTPVPEKQEWINIAIRVGRHHAERLKAKPDWRIEDTAKELKYSIGTISQYLKIASWMKTHENQLRRIETLRECLDWIKKHQRDMIIGSLE